MYMKIGVFPKSARHFTEIKGTRGRRIKNEEWRMKNEE